MGLIVLTLTLISSCDVDDQGYQLTTENENFVYFLVTHGPSTDFGFWGDVLVETRSKAEQLGVGLVPLHPVVEASGELLNAQVSQAISANPPGIVATIWGDGMPEIVKQANASNIPVAAINVYPDPVEYGEGKAEFLLYAGQNDALAAEDVTSALICGAMNLRFDSGTCEGQSVADVFTLLNAGNLHAICFISQQSEGVFTRCRAMKSLLLNQLGLDETQYTDLVWNETIIGKGADSISGLLNSLDNSGVENIIILSQGNSTAGSYVEANISGNLASKITIGTFDISPLICDAIDSGLLLFASDQGHKLQGQMALDYLHFFVTNSRLPELGIAPNGNKDERWILSPDGYPWYKTGPNLLYERCD